MPATETAGPGARPWGQYLTIALVTFGCFAYNLGGPPLFDLDEGAFSEATREMLARGDFLTTYLNGEPRFDKPVLIYWLQALSVTAFGLHEWALRLPSALAASAWALAVFAFVRPRLGGEAAVAAALITATAAAVNVIGRAATADAVFNLFLALAMFDVYRYLEYRRSGAHYRVFAWIGFAVLTKGPIGILIPLAVSALYFAWARDWRGWWRAVFHPPGLALCLAIFLPWYVLEYLDQGQAFVDGFIMKHNVGRFADTMEGHGGSLLYYLPVTLIVLLPFSGLLLALLPAAVRAPLDSLDRWLWLWFVFVFVFFSFSSTQLPHYLLYGASPLFVLMARYREQFRSRWLAYAPALLFFVLLALLPQILDSRQGGGDNAYVQALLERAALAFDRGYQAWLVAAAIGVLALALARRVPPWRGLLAVGLVQTLLLGGLLLPRIGTVQQQPVREAALAARSLQAPVVMWRINTPSFSVYREAVTPRRAPVPGEVVYTRVDRVTGLTRYEILHHGGPVVLARVLE